MSVLYGANLVLYSVARRSRPKGDNYPATQRRPVPPEAQRAGIPAPTGRVQEALAQVPGASGRKGRRFLTEDRCQQ